MSSSSPRPSSVVVGGRGRPELQPGDAKAADGVDTLAVPSHPTSERLGARVRVDPQDRRTLVSLPRPEGIIAGVDSHPGRGYDEARPERPAGCAVDAGHANQPAVTASGLGARFGSGASSGQRAGFSPPEIIRRR